MMSANDNKRLVQGIFAELAAGNSKPFVDSFADDIQWTIIGSTEWSGTFRGKRSVLTELLGPSEGGDMKFLPATLLAATLFFPSTMPAPALSLVDGPALSLVEGQTTSDFSGTWTMDLTRSESPHSGEPFKPVTFVIAQSDKDVRIDTTRGDQKENIVYPL